MSGTVVAVLRQSPASGIKGAALLILEAMKMEHTITAPAAGRSVRSTTAPAIGWRKARI
jgi:3-methylcrotonyl-CoA carboxylase alpha subunit